MMKKTGLTAVFLLFFSIQIAASSCFIAADTGTLQDVVKKWSGSSVQLTATADVSVYGNFHLRVPVSLTFNSRAGLLETGIAALYYPFSKGAFVSLSLVQLGFVLGDSQIEKSVLSLNEVCIGWTFIVGKGFVIEPSVCVRDISGAFSDEYSQIRGEFPCYRTVRGRLCIGWRFGGTNEKKN